MYALIPCCLLLAGGFLTAERKKRPRLALLLKGLASLCFVALGLLCDGWGLVSAGLMLGCIADVVLGLRKLFKSRRTLFFLAGSVVFLCGHLAYLAAVWPMGRSPALCLLLGLAAGAALLVRLYSQIEAGRALKAFGTVYFGVFSLLCAAAIRNAVTAPGGFTVLFAAGVLLFIGSDVILNLYSFGRKKLGYPWRMTYSLLYYAGQLLIALSLRFISQTA